MPVLARYLLGKRKCNGVFEPLTSYVKANKAQFMLKMNRVWRFIQNEIFRIVKFVDSPERIFWKPLILESELTEIWNDFVLNKLP